jgi:hypothetical protein
MSIGDGALGMENRKEVIIGKYGDGKYGNIENWDLL